MTVLFYTLGCKVNQYDTQTLKELFCRHGFSVAKEGEVPDVVVINTCTVTAESDRKGRQAIRRFAGKYPAAVIAVTGCMPQARPEKAEKLTAAHVVIGNACNHRLPQLVKEYIRNRRRLTDIQSHEGQPQTDSLSSENFEGRTRAFVKIEDGCNRFCSYCLIPYARGRVRSKPLPALKEELEHLAANGYKEVVLAGINLTAYGQERGLTLCDAVEAAQAIPEIRRIRLGSMEPDQFTCEMIARLAKCDKLCPQFHLSLQSGSDTVLARMNRHYDTAFYRDLVHHLRQRYPDCAITTDIMCGFPGETEEEFKETLSFMEEIGFAKIHPFAYSPREGTPAAGMQDQVPPAVKTRRAQELNRAAGRTAETFMEQQMGKILPVLFEQQKPDGLFEGHTPHYVPVRAMCEGNPIGQILPVRITETTDEWCVGTPILP